MTTESDPRLIPPFDHLFHQPDANTLRRFERWRRAFGSNANGDPLPDGVRTIMDQATIMMFDAGCYEMVLEGRRRTPTTKQGWLRLHHPTHNLLDRCFHEAQVLAIRRLNDTGRFDDHKKGVYSLSGLLKSMLDHRVLLTRENLCAVNGHALDSRALEVAEHQYVRDMVARTGGSYNVPTAVSRGRCLPFHDLIDGWTETSPEARDAQDTVSEAFLLGLQTRLESVKPLCRSVDQFIAHASSEASAMHEAGVLPDHAFEGLEDAREVIWRILGIVHWMLNGVSRWHALPLTKFNLNLHADAPLAAPGDGEPISRAYGQMMEHTKKWLRTPASWALAPMDTPGA